MFLTRLGEGSRAADHRRHHADRPAPRHPVGVGGAQRILKNTPGIAVVQLTRGDVVRHPLVQGIIDAYEADAEDSPHRGNPADGDTSHQG